MFQLLYLLLAAGELVMLVMWTVQQFKDDWRRGKWSEGSVVVALLWLVFAVMVGVGLWLEFA
ncbi:hypothetical protein [Kingella oralis]|jgi:hypothetical protein|uniref:Uncharacterized protein n=1 Tax=Kingella oralis ATCC 51147 TaxID=629741 RepID=C4GH81_9NEIS|nr:hypothetical protein [Kingella oralis]EEP68319.1 hypothetical protein GCWU000324_00213 [Kingella oralis ATCC 51147]QMT42324.1 hypothetical protein H3L93_10035 [Kingella oralis]